MCDGTENCHLRQVERFLKRVHQYVTRTRSFANGMPSALFIDFFSRQRALFWRGPLMDAVVTGAGPTGMVAALRSAELGAKTVLITRGEIGGMAANDGPIPVRVLAQAARLLREAKQLGKYGISVSEPILDYPRRPRAPARSSMTCANMLPGASSSKGWGSRFTTIPALRAWSTPTRSRLGAGCGSEQTKSS